MRHVHHTRITGQVPMCILALVVLTLPNLPAFAQQADRLPSWNDGPAKTAIVEFVEAIATEDSPDFVPPAKRIAVFDNDGTLWSEQPIYVQLAFAMDRVKALASEHPEWKNKQPFKAVLEDDREALSEAGIEGIVELVMASHAGMTSEEFSAIATDWLATARHPRFNRPYTELVYQPMLELLAYLRANDIKTYIISGGGIEFMRPWTEAVYGIPPEQVFGSSIKTEFEIRDGEPVIVRLPEMNFVDDKAGKPVGINTFIGRRPIAAFGNSDGDLQMLQWTTAGDGRRLGVIVRHDDADREYAYDRDSHVGRLDKAMEQAPDADWLIISMKRDWKSVFPPEQ